MTMQELEQTLRARGVRQVKARFVYGSLGPKVVVEAYGIHDEHRAQGCGVDLAEAISRMYTELSVEVAR